MERLEPYKDFRIRAYQDWSGQWLDTINKFDVCRERRMSGVTGFGAFYCFSGGS
jgi:hypothetical protein